MQPVKPIMCCVLATATLLAPSMGLALNCDQTSISGTWRAAGEGVLCDFQIGSTGDVSGTCYHEALDLNGRRRTVEQFRVGGNFSVSSDCNLSGALEPNDGQSIPVVGLAWGTSAALPVVVRVHSDREYRAELYLIRKHHLR